MIIDKFPKGSRRKGQTEILLAILLIIAGLVFAGIYEASYTSQQEVPKLTPNEPSPRYALIDWIPFDEHNTGTCTGASVYDIIANSIASCSGSPVWVNAIIGAGMNFSSNKSQKVTFNNPTYLTSTGNRPISVDFWFKLNAYCPQFYCGLQIGTGNPHWEIRLSATNNANKATLTIYGDQGGNNFVTISGFQAFTLHRWENLGIWFDGSTSARIYINGTIIAATSTTTGTPTYNNAYSATSFIGQVNTYVNGIITNVFIYNNVLPANTFSLLYAYGIGVLPNPVYD